MASRRRHRQAAGVADGDHAEHRAPDRARPVKPFPPGDLRHRLRLGACIDLEYTVRAEPVDPGAFQPHRTGCSVAYDRLDRRRRRRENDFGPAGAASRCRSFERRRDRGRQRIARSALEQAMVAVLVNEQRRGRELDDRVQFDLRETRRYRLRCCADLPSGDHRLDERDAVGQGDGDSGVRFRTAGQERPREPREMRSERGRGRHFRLHGYEQLLRPNAGACL
jgi:hypothetical protein